MKIETIPLSLSNAFLVRDKKTILVDCGCCGDWSYLAQFLGRSGVQIRSLSAVVLTHAHFDHCGCASFLQAEGVPVIASEQAQPFLSEGRQEDASAILKLAGAFPFVKRMMNQAVQTEFQPVRIDYPVADSLDLSEFGVEGEVIVTGGHTAASVCVLMENRSVCVGDLLMGGMLGLPPAWKPNFHPLNIDNKKALGQIIELRSAGYERFLVGHGDVLSARSVDAWINRKSRSV
ncbi:MAG: hypothetical protein RL189_2631 [Pseudomonadota bacterium]|jgi:glyoxylase-like metal-dependent hydrolase (beta-lactamase superfamily II)